LYRSALARQPGARRAFLDAACGADEDLKRQIALLLEEDASIDGLLDEPASGLLADFTAPHLAAGSLLGRYRIERLLGAGGMGEVYLAHDPRLDRAVAIKLLAGHLMGDAVAHERLHREALAAAALDHPFICKVFEVAEDNGSLYCVMEYIRGETLFDRMRAGRIAWPEAVRIAGEIAEAIEEAHANRFIHRDLKPSNIALTVQGHVKVMDFGLAKRAEQDAGLTREAPLTATDAILGTVAYMSPEQATGGQLDHRSDLFSFGIILAELFNGKHPFQRDSPMETMAAILRDPPDLSTGDGGAGLPAGLLMLVRRLLAKPADERYASMREVRADMARLAEAAADAPAQSATPPKAVIGREQESDRLFGLLDAALAGGGSLALISGEPGIGKTHLARAIQAEAARRGCVTVTGHCYEMEGAPPYVPFIEMLEYSVRVLPRATFRYALGDAAAEVAKLMPELRRLFPDIPPAIELPPEQQRRFLFNAYREFVERGARVTPWVAVFEDLHWADESTLLLLQHLVQSLASVPILIIGTYRDVELDINRPFARTLETWLREKQAARIPLKRFPLASTGALLETLSGRAPPPSAARIVFDHTEGNPFFVEELFRHLAEEGRLFDQQGAWRRELRSAELRVPQGVRLMIGRRLERLPEASRQVLTTAAVIGRSFDLRLLEELERAQPDAALEAMEDGERAHLIEPEGAGRDARYRFAHELIRQTLVGGLSLPRRQRLHARVADALERIYGTEAEWLAPPLAHHLYQSGAAADVEKTVTWLARAARHAAAGAAFEEALTHIDNALSLLADERGLRAAELHAERANALRSLGRMADAIASFEQALALFESNGEANRFAETCAPLAWIYSWTVRLDEARDVCRRGLALLQGSQSPAGFQLAGMMAVCSVLANDAEAGLAVFEQLQKVPLPPDPIVKRGAANLQANLELFCGHLEAAREAADETDRLCEQTGDVWGQTDIAWIRADIATVLGGIEAGLTIARDAIPLAERIGHVGCACFCKWFAYEARVAAGDLAGAAELADVLDEYDRLHYVPWSVVAKVTLANIARLRGHVDEAAEWCRQASIPERNHWGGYPHAALALTFAQSGDLKAADALNDAIRFAPRAGQPAPYGRWPTLNLTIEALATAGRFDDAGALHPVAEEMIDRGFALMKAMVLPRTTAGIAAACAREWSRAESHHQTAIHQADTWPHRVCQPIARYWYAEMLRARGASGDAARARDLLGQALSAFEALGMPLYAHAAVRKLAASARGL
jgi:tetratricopeptide (TPR) repeat protein